ncbi:hypothetical protein EVAR_56828_1 [Eumeta japonica]|uniref:Uncharacterized protein n=1 Tax=Eumeta variegata TaxID=151549 RepID=A0A4C1ZGK1_EUMVA|nr:hypothetical protein EVAR_56828_1 [Eumeta japonica]
MQPGTYGPVSKLTGCRHDSGIVVTKINIIMTTIKALKTQYYLRPSEALQHKKGPNAPVKYHTVKKCRRETAAFALAFRPVSESSRPTSTSHISPVRYPIPSQEAGNAGDSSGVASVDGRR